MRLQRFIALGLALAIIAVTFAGSAITVSAQSFSASVEPLSGVIQRLARGSSTWENVTEATQLRVGDSLRTGSSGSAIISTTLGVQATLLSNTEVELLDLTLSPGTDSKLRAGFGLYIGILYVDVSRKLGSGEFVTVASASGAAVATGTQMYTAVNKDGDMVVIGQESNPVLYSADTTSKATVTPNSLAYTKLGGNPVALASLDSAASVATFKNVLKAFATQFYGVTDSFFKAALNVTTLPQDDDLIKAIDSMSPAAGTRLDTLLETLRTDLRKYASSLLSTARVEPQKVSARPLAVIAPKTCGNNKIDDGETLQNCPDDFFKLVQTALKACKPLTGMSLVNAPAGYCLYSTPRAQVRILFITIFNRIVLIFIQIIIIPPPPSGQGGGVVIFIKGQVVTVVFSAGAGPLNVLNAPNTAGVVVAQVQGGAKLTILGGPTNANGQRWYNVQTPDGKTGYVSDTVTINGQKVTVLQP